MTDTKMTNLEILTKRIERELAEAKSNLAIAQHDYDTFEEEGDHEAVAELRQEISELAKIVEDLEEELAMANDNDSLDDILNKLNKQLGANTNSNQKYTVVTDDQGTTRYFKPGTDELHRLDGPAVVFANGDRLWYKDGQLHRVAGPAIDPIRGKKAWYINGKLQYTW